MKVQDFLWITEHGADLIRDYAGKWIAVADGKVVGVGDTAPQAAEEAAKQVPEEDFILEHVVTTVDVIYVLT